MPPLAMAHSPANAAGRPERRPTLRLTLFSPRHDDALRAVCRTPVAAGQAARGAVPGGPAANGARRRGGLRRLLDHRAPFLPGVFDLGQPAGADLRCGAAHAANALSGGAAHATPV